MKHGKKYRSAAEKIEKGRTYPLNEAIKLASETSTTKFDATIEIHFHLGIDPKQSEQQIRNVLVLPHGTGKKITVCAFVPEDDVKKAIAAGADVAGDDELIEKILKGWTEFDVAIATPDMMKKLAKVARILGTKGLMPNPKAGTVTNDVEKTIQEIKKGRIEYRNDPLGCIHSIIGKVSFGPDKLLENAKSLIDTIRAAKPAAVKGTFIKNISIASTMGPGVTVDLSTT